MSLLNDILQQNNQIAQNPTSVIRTPTQVAYDNLLNRQAEIEKQNKTNGLVGGLMSGIGGLGKIIASAVVKNPFQQAGAMEGLTQQEGRIDQLRQAYENARQTKNRDYIQQAKEQLGMAQADEDKAYNRELTANQIAYKKAQDEIANKLNQDKLDFMKEQAEQSQKNADRDYNLKLSELSNKPAELTEEQKLQNEINKLKAIENAKAEIAAGQDLQKANAEYEAFKSNIPNLKNLSKSSGTVVDRSIGGIAGLFSGKSNNPLTKPNDSMKEVKAQLTNAIYRANGVDGDKISKEQSKMILAQAGMPDTMNLSQSQVDTIIKNIENIYKQRISGKQNFANSFNNSVSWE